MPYVVKLFLYESVIFKYSYPSQGGFSAGQWSAKQYKNKNRNNKEDKLEQVNRSVVQSRNAFAKLISRDTVSKEIVPLRYRRTGGVRWFDKVTRGKKECS